MKKLIHYITLLLFLAAAFYLISCEPEEPQVPELSPKVTQVQLAEEPHLLHTMQDFTRQSLNGRTESAEMDFGTLDFTSIVKNAIDAAGQRASYSIALTPPADVAHSSEYFIAVGGEDGYRGYILQYQTDADHAHTLYSRSSFTGHVRLLDFERRVRAENYFENGVEVDLVADEGGRQELSSNCECAYVYEVINVEVNNALGGTATVRITEINCVCDVPSFQGEGWGASGDGDIGEPIGGDPFAGGGGSSSDPGNSGTPGGIEDGPGDEIAVIDLCHLGFEKIGGECVPECEAGDLRNGAGICVAEWEAVFEELTDLEDLDEEMNDDQQNKLREVFKQIIGLPVHRKFVNILRSRVKLKYRIDPNQDTPGGYDPASKTIKFKSQDYVNYYVLLEEIFHAYQDYVEGISKYAYSLDRKGRSNIEFEAKLYADVTLYRNLDYVVGDLQLPVLILGSNTDEYLTWLKNVTSDHTKYPKWDDLKAEYYNRVEKFRQEKPDYNFPVDRTLQPKTFLHILHNL